MVWYWKVLAGWLAFNLLLVLAAWVRSLMIDRVQRSGAWDWRARHLPERLVRQFFECPWPTFAVHPHRKINRHHPREDVHAIGR